MPRKLIKITIGPIHMRSRATQVVMGKLSPLSQAKHTDTTTEPEPEQRGGLQKEILRLGVKVPLISTLELEVGRSASSGPPWSM